MTFVAHAELAVNFMKTQCMMEMAQNSSQKEIAVILIYVRMHLKSALNTKETLLKKEEEESWEKFRDTGLFHFVNEFLHMFGWCICLNIDDKGKITSAFPQKCSYTGFSEESNEKSYKKVWGLLKDNPDVEKK